MFSPIVLFVYNRPIHTKQTVLALAKNYRAIDSELIVYSDGPKTDRDIPAVEAVRSVVGGIKGFKSLRVICRRNNLGLAKSIVDGVTCAVANYGRVIVLEDDILTHPSFLSFMNDGLSKYEGVSKVASISGYSYPVSGLPENFFLRQGSSWGWGTWEDSWSAYNADGEFLLRELNEKNLPNKFDFEGAYPFYDMLRKQVEGANDSWAIRWYASNILLERLHLFPGQSLTCNAGFDGSGTHCDADRFFDVDISHSFDTALIEIKLSESEQAECLVSEFYRLSKSSLYIRTLRVLRKYLKFMRGLS